MTDDQSPMTPFERLRAWWNHPANEGAIMLIRLVTAVAAIAIVSVVAYRITLVLMARCRVSLVLHRIIWSNGKPHEQRRRQATAG